MSARIRVVVFSLAFAGLFAPCRGWAEVMDKEPTERYLWLAAAIGALSAFTLIRIRWWLVFFILPASTLIPLRAVLDCHDQHVGPAILSEGGRGYILHAHAALLVVVAANVVGLLASFRARRLSRK
jgi:hypothetical protein